MPRAICLVSGGMDSATLLWVLKPDVKALLFNYGQRHKVELEYARRLCVRAGVEWDIVDLHMINHLIAKGSQSGSELPPEGHYTEMSMKTTIVPNRNAIMLSIAVGHAIAIDATQVYFAAHSGDHTIYPDCRHAFVEAFDRAMRIGNEWSKIQVIGPFTAVTKSDIVKQGAKLGVPFELTWSCYVGRDDGVHCGKCGTCVERREAFQVADVEDPTEYAS